MSNRLLRQSQIPRGYNPPDPVSNLLAGTVKDVRNAEILSRMSGGNKDLMNKILEPALMKLGNRLASEIDGGHSPSQEDANEILNQHLKRMLIKKEIEGSDNNHTPKDVMAFAEGAVNIQKAAADTAMATADRERQLRLEAEQNAGASAEYARQEEQQKAATQMEWAEKMYQMMNAATERTHKTELDFRDYQLKTTVENLEKMAQEAIARISGASQESSALKDQLHQKELEVLKIQHEAELVKHKASLPLNQSPEFLHQMNWVQWQALQQQRQLEREDAEHADKLETTKAIREKFIPEGLEAFKNAVQAFTGGNLSLDNPFGPSTPETGDVMMPAQGPGLGGGV